MGFDITLGGAFGAGLLSFLSPCILPIVPFYLCYMAGLSMAELSEGGVDTAIRRKLVLSSVLFAAGMISVFVMLGATASFIGQQFRDWFDYLRYGAGAIILVLGLHFLGILRIPFLYRDMRMDAGTPVGYASAFLVGLAFAFGWTPCVGPVLAAILFAAGAQETAGEGARLLFVYGLGMTAPFVVAAIFSKPFLTWVQGFRRYLPVVEKVMGGLLVVFGLLIVTNTISVVAFWMLSIAPDLGVLQ
ncbi:MAG: cytochrome c biogenesis protein CcdA [Alphaproteobacteria bacterium]|nr:cytochrome c biogenesis protein CcdA [Alphaproteobacteria bacterium]